jgi:hypothetical protein
MQRLHLEESIAESFLVLVGMNVSIDVGTHETFNCTEGVLKERVNTYRNEEEVRRDRESDVI